MSAASGQTYPLLEPTWVHPVDTPRSGAETRQSIAVYEHPASASTLRGRKSSKKHELTIEKSAGISALPATAANLVRCSDMTNGIHHPVGADTLHRPGLSSRILSASQPDQE